MADSSSLPPNKPNNRDKEKEYHKARLSDANFDASRYPDPLVPRPSPDPKIKAPEGITMEMTNRWLDMIREAKADASSG